MCTHLGNYYSAHHAKYIEKPWTLYIKQTQESFKKLLGEDDSTTRVQMNQGIIHGEFYGLTYCHIHCRHGVEEANNLETQMGTKKTLKRSLSCLAKGPGKAEPCKKKKFRLKPLYSRCTPHKTHPCHKGHAENLDFHSYQAVTRHSNLPTLQLV